MSDLPKIEVEYLNRVDTWGSEPKEDNGWISCEDQMPVESTGIVDLLCRAPSGNMYVCWFSDGWFRAKTPLNYDWDANIAITHWMALPLPPMLREQAK